MNNKDRQLLGALAIAMSAVFAIYLSAIPVRQEYITNDTLISGLTNLAPAAGDVVPGSVASAAMLEPENQEAPDPETDLEKGKAYSVIQIFDSEQACKDATSRACHFVKCAGDEVPAAGEVKKHAVENACAENEKTGWRPVVPVPDKTAIPDVVAPPAEMTK